MFWTFLCFTLIHSCFGLSFPHIYTSGTHYQVGFDIGSTFKDRIQNYYKEHPLLYSKFLPWAETPYGEWIVQGYIDITQYNSELIINEIQGIADGASLTFLEVFIMTYEMEISTMIGNKTLSDEPDACSDVYVNNYADKQVAICHNEDTYPLVKKDGYFVTAHIIDTRYDANGKPHKVEQHFTHFTYPGMLPGNAFGFNSHGVIQTDNALYPDLVLRNRTGRNILTRELLGAKDLDEIKTVLFNEGYGTAYGVNLNIGLLPTHENNLPRPEIWNIEVAPIAQHNYSLLDVKPIDTYYYHVNKYRRLKVSERADKIVSSQHRAARIEQLAPAKTITDMLGILGDAKDTEYPIYRTPRPSDPEATVATAVFNLYNQTLHVYKDNPANSSYGPILAMSLRMD